MAADRYLGSDAAVEAVAAAELVAVIRGLVVEGSPYNEAALDWVIRTAPVADQALVNLAVKARDRVLATNSELAELWDESASATWRVSVQSQKAPC